MARHLALAAASALFWCAAAAAAGTASTSPDFAACMDKAGGVTPAMLDCIAGETERQDARLNRAYLELSAGLSGERKKGLVEAQRAWLRFRDLNCAFYDDPDGGTEARVSASDCVMTMTANRAAELEQLGN
jgi:uncharacterized protein YecT (DUF1311 family)